jgi:hypothetical protein
MLLITVAIARISRTVQEPTRGTLRIAPFSHVGNAVWRLHNSDAFNLLAFQNRRACLGDSSTGMFKIQTYLILVDTDQYFSNRFLPNMVRATNMKCHFDGIHPIVL